MLEAIRRILGLTWKELLAVLKDPRGRFTLFVPPVFQCLIYGYVATYDLNDVPYAVLDHDRSAAFETWWRVWTARGRFTAWPTSTGRRTSRPRSMIAASCS